MITGTSTKVESTPIRTIDDYLAAIARLVFQSGMGRTVVDAKWASINDAFDGFDCAAVADYHSHDIDRLCDDQRVIRNRRKIEAIVSNAQTLLSLEADPGFAIWLRSHTTDEQREAALRKTFKFLGPTGVQEFLWIVGETTEPPCAPSTGAPAPPSGRGRN